MLCQSTAGHVLFAGQGSFRDGADGDDLYIKVPVGTIIRTKEAEVRRGSTTQVHISVGDEL